MNHHYPELEVDSSIEDIVSDSDIINNNEENKEDDMNPFQCQDDEEEEESNDMNVTYIHEDDHPTSYDGIVEEVEDNMMEEDDYTSAMSLKRNLSATFEKHALEDEKRKKKKGSNVSNTSNGSNLSHPSTSSSTANKTLKTSNLSNATGTTAATNHGVKAKIKAFEQKNVIIKPKINSDNGNNLNKVRFDTSSHSRPPTAPVPSEFQSGPNNKIKNNNNPNHKKQKYSSDSSLLSVFLRIRPPSASNDAIDKDQTARHNTVEVLPPNSTNDKNNISTSIRTYPPLQSNTSKVVRGQHQLHSSSHNTDLIFNNTSSNNKSSATMDSAVKGVKEFNFNQVFGQESSQEEIFTNVAMPLVEGLFPKDNVKIAGDKVVGKSALLFSYGITNAGKTYTIMGKEYKGINSKSSSVTLDDSHGIIPRTIDHMLSKTKTMENDKIKYQLNVSFVEIYNEQIFDLLPSEKEAAAEKQRLHKGPGVLPFNQSSLRVRESKNGNVQVRGLAKHNITSLARGLELVQKAKSKRHTSSNQINSDSSRSHSICQFELLAVPAILQQMNDVNDSSSIRSSSSAGYSSDDDSTAQPSNSRKKAVTFWIVDLAGSERSKRTGTFGRSTRQKEAALINSSLMKLMRCLQTLRQNQSNKHMSVVPFRESKLTHLFMGHLTGAAASRTSMIVNINPSIADFDETQHVLSYATDAKSIRISESDYNRKRRAILIAGDGTAPLSQPNQEGKKSPPRKIARFVKKLSPRAALARMKEQKQEKKRKLKESQETHKGVSKAKIAQLDKKGGYKAKFGNGKNKQLESEIEKLRNQLVKSKDEVERYQNEAITLRGKLVRCEADIRKELYEETEHYHQCIHQQHNEIVARLKQQVTAASHTPSKSTRKVQIDKADAMIDELMDKVDECEEEMIRMAESHQEETTRLKKCFSEELAKKEEEMQSSKKDFQRKLSDYNEQINKLQNDLGEKSKMLEEMQSNSTEQGSDEYMESSESDADQGSVHNKENEISGSCTGPSPRLRRLPRRRCSEVACANISPPKEEPISSSTKKKRKGLSKIRSPFSQKSNRLNNGMNDGSSSKTSNQVDSDVVGKDIIFPTSQPEYDEAKGSYLRPRGRAPVGRAWDAKAGGWRRFG